MAAAIETKQLTKSYRSRVVGTINVVDHLDLHVEEGEIFGFLGPNGAGKTTTIKMLLGIIYPTSGEGYVLGKEIGDMDVHRQISYLPERPYYYEHMTGPEILRFYGSLFGINDRAKFSSLLEKVNLHRDVTKTISQYSKGMQQRIGLAQSLINDPKLLFLDEPTGGLDPIAHREIRDLILGFRDEGRTVFISSHELSEVELICDRVAIINRGVIEQQGKLTELLKGGRIEITVDGVNEQFLRDMKINDSNVRSLPIGILLDMPEEADPNAVIDSVRGSKGRVLSVVPRRKRLEDLFVETVTNRPRSTGGDTK
ncbi:MAG TPA: ABC transporter ATP-binding protein [Fimbriimonas sp.]|nr:ABC transporter ATP-binding protein [Fimbriimonas sp.]